MDRIEELEAQVRQLHGELSTLREDGERRSTRRGMLRLAGAAAVGGAAAVLAGKGEAAATTGNMQYGVVNDALDSPTTLSCYGNTTFFANNVNSGGTGVVGQAISSGSGVHGLVLDASTTGYGVWGRSDTDLGLALVGTGGAAQLFLNGPIHAAMPSAGSHMTGEIVASSDSGMYACVDSGTPGTWRTLVHPNAAGAFFPITPSRVFDTRLMVPATKLARSTNRTVSVADSIDPVTGAQHTPDIVPSRATAIAYNITIVGTVGGGNIAVNPGGNTTAAASVVNWNKDSMVVANSSVVALSASREVTVICNGGVGASTHFVIDVLGCYR